MRVGIGYDTHPFIEPKPEGDKEGRREDKAEGESPKPLILGGVFFEGEAGLEGHSDGDAICHALSDALLGAAGLPDMGELFPDTDPNYKDADSLKMLEEVVKKVKASGFSIGNANCVIIADKPKISPKKAAIQKSLQKVLGAPVNVGGKRTEGMAAGKEGITCIATALLIGDGSLIGDGLLTGNGST